MIIHSPIISGSLTFAEGAIVTYPDGGSYSGSFSGSLTVHELNSHIIPNGNEIYDLGSEANRFRDIYISSGTMRFPGGGLGMNDNGEFTLKNNDGNPAPVVSSEIKISDPISGDIIVLKSEGGQLKTSATNSSGTAITDPTSNLSGSFTGSFFGDAIGSFTGSFLGDVISTNGIVSGSEQIQIGSVSGFSTFSSSVDTRILTEKGRIDAILDSSTADKDSFAEIVSLINSVDTDNDNAFASFYTSSNQRFDSIETFTSSIDNTVKTKLNTEGVISGSSQITITESQISDFGSYVTTNSLQALSTGSDALTFASNILTLTRGDGSTDTVDLSAYLDEDSRSISSGEVDGSTGIVTFTRDDDSTFTLDLSDLLDDTNLITSVAGKTGVVTLNTDDVSEGSTNVYFSDIRVKTKLNTEGVISGSSQITITESQISDLVHYTDSDVKTKLNTETVISGSSQVDLENVQGDTDDVSEGSSNLYFTDTRVKTKLNTEGVISGSSQITITESQISDLVHYTDSDVKTKLNTEGVISGSSQVTINESQISDLVHYTDSDVKTKLNAEGVLSGSSQVDLENVQGDTDDVSEGSTNLYFTDARATSALSSHTSATDNPHSVTKSQVGLGNVTNESKETMFSSPTFTGTVSGVTKSHVGLGNVDNTSDSSKPISTATQTALDGKLNINGDGVISGSDQVTLTQSQISDVTATAAEINKLDGVTATTAELNILDGVTSTTAELNILDGVTATTAELNYVDGVTSNIQTQLNSKQASGDYVDLSSDQTITGTKTFQDIAVNGTGSFAFIQSVTGSAKIIGDAYIILNADSPAEQYSGIKVYDSGSGDTGSLEYDSANNHWFYESTTEGYASGLIAGPRDSRGAITFPSNNTIVKGIGGNHVSNSNITDNGTTITLGSNTTISGGLTVTSITLDGTAITATAAEINKLDGVTATTTELNYVDGVTSAIQTQLNGKAGGDDFDADGTFASLRAQGTTKGDVGLGNVENTALSTYTGQGGALDNQYITNGAGYITSFTNTQRSDEEIRDVAAAQWVNGTNTTVVKDDANNTIKINSVNTNTTYSAGTGISLSGTTFSIGQSVGTGDNVTFGTVRVDDATASTTKTTGALIVDGGVGIGGALNVGGDVVAYASSDKRLKDNIVNIENPIEKVQKLNGVTWDWNGNADELQQSLPNVGVIAQEVEEVFPQLVHDRDNGYKGVDYAKLTGLLIEAVKEQQKQIDELKSRLG